MASSRLFFVVAAVAVVSQCQVAAVSAAVAGVSGAALFARSCVKCDATTPVCDCKSDETCSLVSQTCDACAYVQCTSNSPSGGSSPPIGAIVGGAIGGIIVVALLLFLWRKKCGKQQRERASMAATAAEKENDFGMLKSQRASTHTVASIASTVRTRASNVIQIAYIPGVTNRSAPASPSHLVPPVPPIPAMGSPVGSQFPRTPTGDIQFNADDLLRRSVATVDRSSVATTIYGQNAVVSQPNIVRAGKANVVQVKNGSSAATSSTNSPSLESAPPIPPLFAGKNGLKPGDGKPMLDTVPPSPAFSIGSTFFNRMNSTKSTDGTETARVRVIGGRSERNENHSTSSFVMEEDSDDDLTPEDRRKKAQSQCSSCITDMDTGSPFSDANSMDIDALPAPAGAGLPPGTQARKPAAGKRSSQRIRSLVGGDERTVSPFDDSHSIDKAGS